MYVLLCMNQISKITLIYWTRIQRKGCVIIVHVLMQTCVLQSWVFVVAPTHSAPPYCGAGFVHVLSLSCVPPPHVTVHVPQEPQLLNPPSTVRKCEHHYIMDVGWRCFYNYSIKNDHTYSGNGEYCRLGLMKRNLDMDSHCIVVQGWYTCAYATESHHRTWPSMLSRTPKLPTDRQLWHTIKDKIRSIWFPKELTDPWFYIKT